MPTPRRRGFAALWASQPPARRILFGFILLQLVGWGLLSLPISRSGPGGASWIDALFTAVSAVCVTGLTTVDTLTYWTPFGHVVIIALIQLGGLGVMVFASIIGVLVVRRLSLTDRVSTAAEAHLDGLHDVGGIVRGILSISLTVEGVVAVALGLRFWLGYGEDLPYALWLGLFHAVSSFNNAGFALFSDNIVGFVADPFICVPLAISTIIGGLGFPVIVQILRHWRHPIRFTMNTWLVLTATVALLTVGTIAITALEWSNPNTLGALDPGARLLAGFFQSVQTRTSGFNSVDIGALTDETWLVMDVLMFIGGGPAGTAGGIKVTTFGVLAAILIAEVRGDGAVSIFGKRLSRSVHRQVITVAIMAIGLVMTSTLAIMLLTAHPLGRVLFEVISAFGTVGLSTGITADLGVPSQLILIMLMFLGRVGPITVATSLALRSRKLLYQLPKERPIIG